MKLKLIALFILCLSMTAQAQNARAILDKASAAYTKAGGITASFTLDSRNKQGQQTYNYSGKALMKGNKFKLDIPNGATWFDGKTQWVYFNESDEVNISNPTGEELQTINPAAMFGIYKTGYNLNYKGAKSVQGKRVVEVEMIAQKKNNSMPKIVVQIDEASNIFSTIAMFDKNGNQNKLTITSLKTGVALSDASFVFNKKDYPQAEVIDLR